MAITTIVNHQFTSLILEILNDFFDKAGEEIFSSSSLLQYINLKTKSANKGSKSRGSFASLYALYVVIEDYIQKDFSSQRMKGQYSKYDGAKFSDLLTRQRTLPFGNKLQNHALNSRLNEEFKKYFDIGIVPITRNLETQRYWIQEDLLLISIKQDNGESITYNIAPTIIKVVDLYISKKKEAFDDFIETCHNISKLSLLDTQTAEQFIISQLQPNVDARVFEIVSYSILKARYGQEKIWIGKTKENVAEEALILYKTGRTNANDGGIDFVMKPLGRFFQVTETIDVCKYFLDIDKIQRFPITFVVKSTLDSAVIISRIRKQAETKYKIESVVNDYMDAIEEVINVVELTKYFQEAVALNKLNEIMEEIITQSQVEFNQTIANYQ
jgi:hypothetical protein